MQLSFALVTALFACAAVARPMPASGLARRQDGCETNSSMGDDTSTSSTACSTGDGSATASSTASTGDGPVTSSSAGSTLGFPDDPPANENPRIVGILPVGFR
ncbi:hypothetical protein NA57DRAFT_50963 [Rhizodiscina lignyota]|uniref:Uncharacterized protein n=1 Tax=Rhizodiscina lignyota TaxID=1504668 RepID=A0A9P4ITQ8_9PEZI|nr:hypothetical protein NA57DRAFT_50963 [Rhizodiscina lignyota]